MGKRWTWGVAICVFVLSPQARAQTTTGNIVGVVSDSSAAVLPGATVTVRGPSIVGGQSTTTNERGFYRFPALPPGVYSLNFALTGFAGLTEAGIKVSVGTTTERNVTLNLSGAVEEVTVTGESPIDSQSTQVSTTFDKDWVRNAPLNRNSFFDIANSAPGITTSGPSSSKANNSTAFGSSTTENTYMMDGTDLTAPYDGQVWPLPNTDAIEEIQVLGLGAPAEYGNLQGAVFNVVTRQGTNDFHGDANFYFQTDKLTSTNTNASDDGCPSGIGRCPYHRSRYDDLSLQLSGPIIKDKIWFFLGYGYKSDRESQPGTDPSLPINDQRQSGIAKLTWQISSKQKVMLAYHEDYYSLPFLVTATSPPSATNVDHGTSPTPNVTYTATLSDKTYVEARYAGFYGSDHGDPVAGPRVGTRFFDLTSGATSGGIFDWYDGDVNRTGFNAKVSHFADNFLGGSHDFKFGVQYAKGGADYITGYNDYVYTGGAYLYGYHQNPYHNAGQMRTIGVYVDDTYRLGSRLTLNLGLRYDNSKASFAPRPILDANGSPTGAVSPGVNDLFTWNVFSPRVGFVLKLTPDGKSLLKGHYGRYYRGLITSEFDSASPSIPAKYLFSGTYDASGNPIGETVFSDNSHLSIDPNFRDPYTDQYIGSLEQQIGDTFGLSVTYVHKVGSNYAGWTDLTGQYVSVPYVDNVGAGATGQTLMLQQLVSDPSQRVFELTNPQGLSSKYDGGVLAFTKRMAHHWQFSGSILLSKSQGRIASSLPVSPNNVTLDQSSTGGVFNSRFFGRNPNNYLNTYGLLLADRPVVVKGQFLYEFTKGFLLGVNYLYESGRPWARELDVSSVVNVPGTFINAETVDGSRRLESLSLLDARLQKAFALGGQRRFDVFADGLNLLNTGAAEGLLSQVATQGAYAQPSNFAVPRRFMVGAKFEF